MRIGSGNGKDSIVIIYVLRRKLVWFSEEVGVKGKKIGRDWGFKFGWIGKGGVVINRKIEVRIS